MKRARGIQVLKAKLRAVNDPSTIDPMVTFGIKVDTREGNCWSFYGTPTVVGALESGDYSVVGFETEVAIERKSLDDLVSSLTWGADRFGRELDRLRSYRLAVVIIEAGPDSIAQRKYRAPKMEPAEVFELIAAKHVSHGIPFCYAGSRKNAASMAFRLLHAFWRHRVSEIGKEKTRDLEAKLLAKETA